MFDQHMNIMAMYELMWLIITYAYDIKIYV